MYDAHPTPLSAKLPTARANPFVELDVPLARTTSYAPRGIALALTAKQARTLADLAEGLRQVGQTVRHPADAIKLLLDAIDKDRYPF